MTAVDDNRSRHLHPKGRCFQIARHRVLRWFRPPEAEQRRARLQPHPLPGPLSASPKIVKVSDREPSA